LDGQRLDTLGEGQRSALRRDRFGFVFQSGRLVPELTAEENVALPLLLSGTRRGPALTAARAWFGRLRLDGLERRRSGELSGGQAQRVVILVTHDARVAAYADREVVVRDGIVTTLTGAAPGTAVTPAHGAR
jgi:putative ABC transport system ATP-binding protein